MDQEFLLDTNAFYNLLKAINPGASEQGSLVDSIAALKHAKLVVSSITEIEIISVLGKYARGSQGSISKCNCKISPEGHICQNNRYAAPRKKWNKKRIKAWLQLINDIFEGKSELLTVDIEPFDSKTVAEAKNVITYALIHNFASMDAMIAATAKLARDNSRDVTVVTSDRGLKACLSKIDIPCNDVFAANEKAEL